MVFEPLRIIPRSIALEEILLLAQKNPVYFQRTRTRVVESASRGGREVEDEAPTAPESQ